MEYFVKRGKKQNKKTTNGGTDGKVALNYKKTKEIGLQD